MSRRIVIAVVLLTGCSFFSRSKSSFYSLDRIPRSTPVVAVKGIPFGVDSVQLPAELDRREVVVRKDNHQLDVRSNQQWSAAFHDIVMETLVFDLASRLPEGMVVLPGAARPTALRAIDVVFEDLAAGPQNTLTLDAHWTVRQGTTTSAAHHEQISIPLQSLDSAQVAAAVSQALAGLADRISSQL